MEILERLVRAVVAEYASDAIAAGVVTSRVNDEWYVSVVRCFKEGRTVVVNCTGDDLWKLYAELLELFNG
jgi:fructose-1-phosphate kinase PfkB-like protein